MNECWPEKNLQFTSRGFSFSATLTEGEIRVCCHELIIIKQEVTHLSALPSASVQLPLLCPVTCEHLSAEEHKELPRVIITLIRLALHLSTNPQRPAFEPVIHWVLKVVRVGVCQNCVSGELEPEDQI